MASRIDVSGGVKMGAWTGYGSYPFGLISCPGWIKPISRLSIKLASLNRHHCRRGCAAKIINIRPSRDHFVFDLSIKNFGIPSPLFLSSLHAAIAHARRDCARMCAICGMPARPVFGLSLCYSHAPESLKIETSFDKRKIRRSVFLLARTIGARITGVVTCHLNKPEKFRVFDVNGADMVMVMDAPCGSRLQLIDSVCAIIHEPLKGEFLLEFYGRLVLRDRI
jgi:hypothetical protein